MEEKLNKTTCWNCSQDFTYDGDKYRDVDCPSCKCMNSIYNPADVVPSTEAPTTESEWLQEEEKMKPPKREVSFEKVAIGEFINGVIENIQYDNEHKFKGFSGGPDTIQPAVRLKFALEGYKFPHYSRWFKFNYGEKANLYKIFLTKLVEGAKADMDFDLDALRGLKVKTLWNENGDFQNLESIFPLEGKIAMNALPATEEIIEEPGEEDETI